MTDQKDFDDALSRVFARVEKAGKDAKGQARRGVYMYATLASVTDAISEALTAEGFSWPQLLATRVEIVGEGSDRFAQIWVDVTTQLRRGGVLIESTLAMPVGGNGTPQDIGSAITYGRRYGLSAAVGVCPEDDDGNAASQPRERNDGPARARFTDRGEREQQGPTPLDRLREDLDRYTNQVARVLEVGRADAEDEVVAVSTVNASHIKGQPTADQCEALIAAAKHIIAKNS